MRPLLVYAALIASLVYAADEGPPKILGVSASYLAPGAILRIAGERLGPSPGCEAKADPLLQDTPNPHNPDLAIDPLARNTWVYPKELCGVQVFLNDLPAGLAYVSAGQINLKLPQDSPEDGTASLRVVYRGQSGASMEMPAGWGKTTVALAEPAYVGMPVWLKVELRYGLGSVGYPSLFGPAAFGCNQVEVRRDGKLLAFREGADWSAAYPHVYSGPPCPSLAPPDTRASRLDGGDRLPLHLLYRFDTAGTYEVRFTLRQGLGQGGPVRAQSDWTPIEILPARPNQRRQMLDAVKKRNETDPAALLHEVLPSVLGFPDQDTLELVSSELDNSFRGVRQYVLGALSFWPADVRRNLVFRDLQAHGPTDETVRFLADAPEFKARQAEILNAALPYLDSDSAAAIDGAIVAVILSPAPHEPAVYEAELRAVERIHDRSDVRYRNSLLSDLASPNAAVQKDPRVRALLLNLLAQSPDNQAAICLTWQGNPADLPRLAQLLSRSGSKEQFSGLPQALYRAYGTAAVPYLETALRASPGRFTNREIAMQLMKAAVPEGFRYALEQIAPGNPYRLDMLQALRDQFPELKGSSDTAAAEFLKARAGN